MRNTFYLFLLLFIGLLPLCAHSQATGVSGTIVDSLTRQPLAFVSVTVKETKRGGVTDIDGHFTLKNVSPNSTLLISCIGYAAKSIPYTRKSDEPLVISLVRKNDVLDEVIVTSDLNPAHRIIKLMQENKKLNDPLYQPSYAYNAYTVAAIGAGERVWTMGAEMRAKRKPEPVRPPRPDKKRNLEKERKDSMEERAARFAAQEFKKNYFFVTESYTERKYKYFKQSKETVLATKVSGIKDPLFAVTSSNFQPFGFYLDFLPMINKVYTSPVINGSIDLYKFNLREVIPHEKDTTFVISFEPRKGKTFEGLKGVLYINSDGYAIENVIASPSDDKGHIFTFRLQQKYERVDGHWFPSQLNTFMAQKDVKKDSVLIYWDTRSYMKNVTINKPFTRSEFSDVALDFVPGAGRQSEAQWQTMRVDSLQAKEKATYNAYDSLPKDALAALNFMNKASEALAIRGIPWGKIDIPFRYLISGLNRYESVRFGFGFQTNTRFSKWFSTGGYAGYGIGDKAWKYGGDVEFMFNRRTSTKLRFSFSQDLQEPGMVGYFKDNGAIISNQSLRNLYTDRLDSVREWKVMFSTKPRPFLQTDAWLLTEQRNPAGFTYQYDIDGNNNFTSSYNNTEAGIGLRYTRGETYAKLGRAKIMNTPPKTQIMFEAARGLNGVFNGQLSYTKLALEVDHSFHTKHFGRTSFQLDLGQVWGNVPYAYLFNTKGSIRNQDTRKRNSGLFIPNSFQTVGIYEFTSDRSASLFLQQNFGGLLFKPANPMFRPEFILVQNIGYGSISNIAAHKGVVLQAPEKGLFESGVLVNNLIRFNMRFYYLGIGAGVFRRYGYYALPEAQKNMAFKIGLTASF